VNDNSAFLAALTDIVGAANVLTDPDLVAPYLEEPRGLFHGRALAVARPGSTAEVAAVVRACVATGVAIVPQGGNTGMVGGQTPDGSGRQLVVSLRRMNRIREVDVEADAMIVEAGVTLAEAQAAAEAADRMFPLALASEGTCTIGGNLSSNAGGVAVLAYGNARELTLGVEVVLADGRVANLLSKLRKDNTGYDLKDLFVGAEGTLGIVTAASLKLFARPRARATAFVGLADPHRALALLKLARQRFGQQVTSFEIMPRIGMEFALAYDAGGRDPLGAAYPWYALIEVSAQDDAGLDDPLTALLGEALERELIFDAALAASLEQRDAFWRLRESMSDAQKPQGGSIKHDVSVPLGQVPAFIAEATAAVAAFAPGARVVAFGHLGDGNIHFNVSQPIGADKQVFLDQWSAMNAVVHAVVARHSGSISAEHGVGALKRDLLKAVKDPVALELMRAVKAAIDPRGLFNPGKVL